MFGQLEEMWGGSWEGGGTHFRLLEGRQHSQTSTLSPISLALSQAKHVKDNSTMNETEAQIVSYGILYLNPM